MTITDIDNITKQGGIVASSGATQAGGITYSTTAAIDNILGGEGSGLLGGDGSILKGGDQ